MNNFIKHLTSTLVLSVCSLNLFAAHTVRDWNRFPAIVQIDSNKDVFVVGDVHADYQRLLRVLQAAHVVGPEPSDPSHPHWIANDAILVFLGDLIDKGDHALAVITFIRSLRADALAKGGQVLTLMGNHEAEFLADPTEKKSQEFANELKAKGLSPSEVASCRGDVGEFLCTQPFAVRIRTWFFSHAGNTHGQSMPNLIETLETAVNTQGFHSERLIGADSLLEARLGEKGVDGRPWFENSVTQDAKSTLTQYATALGVKHIVQGHQHGRVVFADGVTREKGEIFQRYGLIFLVDTGMSQGVDDSRGVILHITPEPSEQAIAICPDGTKTIIWDSRTLPPIGSARACSR